MSFLKFVNDSCRLSKRCYYHPYLALVYELVGAKESAESAETAETTDSDVLIIAFKGTTTAQEVGIDLTFTREKTSVGRVHSGFWNYFHDKHKPVVDELLRQRGDGPVLFTGHSLGGALATLAASLYAPNRRVGCITFGAPRVGDDKFAKRFNETVDYSLRMVNAKDPYTKMPPKRLYKHVGKKVLVDADLFDRGPHKLEGYCPCLKKE